MKKLFVILGVMITPIFSDTFICSYHLDGGETSLTQAILVDVIHDSVQSRFIQNYSLKAGLKSVKVGDACKRNGVDYKYEVEIDMDETMVEEGLNEAFYQFKQRILSLSIEQVNAILKSAISRKFFNNEKEKSIQLPVLTEEMVHYFINELKFSIRPKESILGDLDIDFRIQRPRDFFFSLVSFDRDSFHPQASSKDQQTIRYIITEMGEKDLYSLFKKRKEMNKMGDQIRHVPPMDFLAVIFSQNDLKNHMHSIKKSMFKWNNIVDNIGENMKKEKKHADFDQKVRAFANYLGVDGEVLIHKAHHNDWSGFITHLF